MADLTRIVEAVVAGDQAKVLELTQQAVSQGINPEDIIYNGLVKGMNIVADKWKRGEFFVPEVLVASRAMKGGMSIVTPLLGEASEKIGTIVLGTAQGDIHDIGKNLVALMMDAGGFQVVDLGVNVQNEKFIQAVQDHSPQLVGISALLTTTMPFMQTLIETLKRKGLRNKVKIMVGGAPVSQEYADEIGADGYAKNAPEAVEKAKELIKQS